MNVFRAQHLPDCHFFSGLKVDLVSFKNLSGIGGLALFAIAFRFLLNIVDKKLVSRKVG